MRRRYKRPRKRLDCRTSLEVLSALPGVAFRNRIRRRGIENDSRPLFRSLFRSNNRTGTEAMTRRPIGVDEFVMDWKLIDEQEIRSEIGRLQRRLLDDLR